MIVVGFNVQKPKKTIFTAGSGETNSDDQIIGCPGSEISSAFLRFHIVERTLSS
jgi:hypothetical protein